MPRPFYEELIHDLRELGMEMRSTKDPFGLGVGDRRALPLILRNLARKDVEANDKEYLVRHLAVRGLRGVWDELITEFQGANHDGYKWAIGNTLFTIKDPKSLPAMRALCADKRHGASRQMMVWALGAMRDRQSLPLLIRLLEDWQVAAHAAIALGELREPAAILYLEPYTFSEWKLMQTCSRTAIRKLAKRTTVSPVQSSFHRLAYPDYGTNSGRRKVNPIRLLSSVGCAVDQDCPRCGNAMLQLSRHPRAHQPAPAERLDLEGVLARRRWEWNLTQDAIDELRTKVLQPGPDFGTPRGELFPGEIMDIVHLFPGVIWVREHVMEAITAVGAKGVEFREVEFSANKRGKRTPPPKLWSLEVTGTGWSEGIQWNGTLQCPACNRLALVSPLNLDVDMERWDGSDFFHIDRNPFNIIVSTRICQLFAERGFSNYVCGNTLI